MTIHKLFDKQILSELILGLVFTIITVSPSYGQDTEIHRVSNKSTNPDGFSNQDGVSVDMYRGTLSYSIPLYVFQGREMNFPVTLSYSANGIKVDQVASNVGLGWNLNVGGGISRIVNGQPDYRFGTGVGWTSGVCSNLQSEIVGETYWGNWPCNNTKDYYKVSSLGLEEILNEQLNIVSLIPQLNQNRTVIGYPSSNQDITIIDEDGTKYVFGIEGRETNISDTSSNGCVITGGSFTSYYHLTEVRSKNGLDQYSIEYQTFIWKSSIPNNGEGEKVTRLYNGPLVTGLQPEFKMISSSYRMIQKMPIAIYHNGKKVLSFNYDNRDDLSFKGTTGNKLTDIEILSFNDDEASIKIEFSYSYFGTANVQNRYLDKRLKLDRIRKSGTTSAGQQVSENLFQFTYENPEYLPPIDSFARDYLGLYNGKTNNENLIPTCDSCDLFGQNDNWIEFNFNTRGSSRSFSFEHAIIGTLTSVTNGTGGKTYFSYEQNSLTAPGGTFLSSVSSEPADGFRIKSITQLDHNGFFVGKKNYLYLKSRVNERVINGFKRNYSVGFNPEWEIHQLSRGYQNPNDFLNYSNVVEMSVDSNDQANGYVQYLFGNQEAAVDLYDVYHKSTIAPFDFYADPDVPVKIRGSFNYTKFDLLTSKRVYDKNLVLLFEDKYNYDRQLDYHAYDLFGNNEWVVDNSTVQGNYECISVISLLNPYAKSKTILTSVERFYNESYPEYYTSYEYDDYFRQTSIFKSYDAETVTYEYAPFPFVSKITSSLKGVTKFNYNDANFPHLVTSIEKAKPGQELRRITEYRYDQFGNKVETVAYTPGSLTPASYESYIYGYDNRFVVAKLSGVSYAQIENIAGRISEIKNASNVAITDSNDELLRAKLNLLRTDFPEALITTFTYNPVFGVTSVTDPKGYTVYTEYDALGRVKYTKERNPSGIGFNILSENQYHTISNP